MTRGSRVQFFAASLFSFVNLAGGVYALATGEPSHAAVHAVLLAAGVIAMRVLAARREPQPHVAAQPEMTRLDELQRSVDALALEVERMGEAQRYIAKVAAEQTERAAVKREP